MVVYQKGKRRLLGSGECETDLDGEMGVFSLEFAVICQPLQMDIQYVYTKKRLEFGRQVQFTDRPVEIIADIQPNPELVQEYIARNPVDVAIQNAKEFSEHWVRVKCFEVFVLFFSRSIPFDSKQNIGASIMLKEAGQETLIHSNLIKQHVFERKQRKRTAMDALFSRSVK